VPDRAAVAEADPDPEAEADPAPAQGTQVSTGTQDAELEPLIEDPCELADPLAPPEDVDPCSPDLLGLVAAAPPGPPPSWQLDTAAAVNAGISPWPYSSVDSLIRDKMTYRCKGLAAKYSRYITIFSFAILKVIWPTHTVVGEEPTTKLVILGRAVSDISFPPDEE